MRPYAQIDRTGRVERFGGGRQVNERREVIERPGEIDDQVCAIAGERSQRAAGRQRGVANAQLEVVNDECVPRVAQLRWTREPQRRAGDRHVQQAQVEVDRRAGEIVEVAGGVRPHTQTPGDIDRVDRWRLTRGHRANGTGRAYQRRDICVDCRGGHRERPGRLELDRGLQRRVDGGQSGLYSRAPVIEFDIDEGGPQPIPAPVQLRKAYGSARLGSGDRSLAADAQVKPRIERKSAGVRA